MAEQQKTPGAEKKKGKLAKGRHPSAFKRQRQNEKRRARNQAVLARLKTAMRKVRLAVEQKKGDEAREIFKTAASLLARAASKGSVHHRYASRHTARLATLIHSL